GKRLNRQLTLWKNDKIPYGTWYAYNNLKSIYPDAEVIVNKEAPEIYHLTTELNKHNKNPKSGSSAHAAYIIISPSVAPGSSELEEIFRIAAAGHHVLISSFEYSNSLLDSFRVKVRDYDYAGSDSLTVTIQHPTRHDTSSFIYPGDSYDSHLSKYDSSITEVLGYDKKKRPNFVRFAYQGGGSVMLHFAPLAFSNFFLLHKNNKAYYDEALSYIPQDVSVVMWDDYFRSHRYGDNQEKSDFSAFRWMMKQPPLAWMLAVLLVLFTLIYLFESKRRQRTIPVKTPLKNSSVDFVKTIGRLYFQRRDNKNLTTKLTTHFLDQVRQQYNITTSTLDKNFEKKLAHKSGHSEEDVRKLLETIHVVNTRPLISDELLLKYSDQLEKFKNSFKDGR
ncbi:MAG: hypothetical protein ABW174_06390, partial [Flavitalea sp.]